MEEANEEPSAHKEAAEVFQITIGKILNGDIRGYKSGFIKEPKPYQRHSKNIQIGGA